jgi:regulator of protease activity HflC (stomatin/prohibitin superfamily)
MDDAVMSPDVQSPGSGSPEGAAQELLGHLLKIEAEAAALVDDAQAEADRRVAEGERQNRARYEEGYSREASALEAEYTKEIAAVRENYRKELDAYRDGLAAIKTDIESFSALMNARIDCGRRNREE